MLVGVYEAIEPVKRLGGWMLAGANCQVFRNGVWTLEHRVGDGLATCQPDVSERAIGDPNEPQRKKQTLIPGQANARCYFLVTAVTFALKVLETC
mgnify:CR=1 FL=1